VIGWHLLVLTAAPLTLPMAALVGVLARSTRPLRTTALLIAYAALELRALARIIRLRARGDGDWQRLVHWFLQSAYASVRRTLDVHVRLEEGSATAADVSDADGVVVLARHSGPGDTVLIAWLLVVHYHLRLRVVLKSLLRAVPTIDLAGDMLPFCFIGANRSAARRGIAELAHGLSRGEALLLFPEGGNFSRRRWVTALRRLAASREGLRVRRLRRNKHTLPPHVGGVAAALSAAPDAAVLFLAHTGLGAEGHDRPWWWLPVNQQLTMRTLFVPAERVPHDPAAISHWLDAAWTRIDTWVEGHVAMTTLTSRSGDMVSGKNLPLPY
jgi:1-acyl-sn-glycerol-3-phosphate acyltransferase